MFRGSNRPFSRDSVGVAFQRCRETIRATVAQRSHFCHAFVTFVTLSRRVSSLVRKFPRKKTGHRGGRLGTATGRPLGVDRHRGRRRSTREGGHQGDQDGDPWGGSAPFGHRLVTAAGTRSAANVRGPQGASGGLRVATRAKPPAWASIAATAAARPASASGLRPGGRPVSAFGPRAQSAGIARAHSRDSGTALQVARRPASPSPGTWSNRRYAAWCVSRVWRLGRRPGERRPAWSIGTRSAAGYLLTPRRGALPATVFRRRPGGESGKRFFVGGPFNQPVSGQRENRGKLIYASPPVLSLVRFRIGEMLSPLFPRFYFKNHSGGKNEGGV